MAEALKQLYPPGEGGRRVFTRPGALTDRLRRGWGLQWMKKDEKGERIPDNRHHALDAIVVAACTESQLQRLTKAFQEEEAKGSPRDFRALDQPWPGFREEAMEKVGKVFVSRAERRRARGEAHAATIRSVSERDGEKLVFERKRVADLKLTDLDKVKDPERNKATIDNLRAWIESGKPETAPPLSPKGDPIAKVTLLTNKKPDVIVREGAVDRGEMARVDVFKKQNKKGTWQFYLVPIYPHQIAKEAAPPLKAMQAHEDEDNWPIVDRTFEFLFALEPMTFIEMVKSDGELISGYFRDVNRNDAGIRVSAHHNNQQFSSKIGSKTLRSLQKYNVDRLGKIFAVGQEQRTWRGKVCT